MRPYRLLCAALLLVAGCVFHIGTRAEDFEVANSPAGSDVELDLTGGARLQGELLAARDTGIVLLSVGQIALVRYESLRRLVLPKGLVTLASGRRPDSAELRDLRLMSRFPQGVDDALMARLLTQQNQAALQVLKP